MLYNHYTGCKLYSVQSCIKFEISPKSCITYKVNQYRTYLFELVVYFVLSWQDSIQFKNKHRQHFYVGLQGSVAIVVGGTDNVTSIDIELAGLLSYYCI